MELKSWINNWYLQACNFVSSYKGSLWGECSTQLTSYGWIQDCSESCQLQSLKILYLLLNSCSSYSNPMLLWEESVTIAVVMWHACYIVICAPSRLKRNLMMKMLHDEFVLLDFFYCKRFFPMIMHTNFKYG